MKDEATGRSYTCADCKYHKCSTICTQTKHRSCDGRCEKTNHHNKCSLKVRHCIRFEAETAAAVIRERFKYTIDY